MPGEDAEANVNQNFTQVVWVSGVFEDPGSNQTFWKDETSRLFIAYVVSRHRFVSEARKASIAFGMLIIQYEYY